MLKETIMALTLTGALALTNAAADDSTRSKASDDHSRGNKLGKQVITGVVDQTGDTFVIATEDRLRPIARLAGRGFKDTNFARFLGLKVRIKGTLVGDGEPNTLEVSSLKDIVRVGPKVKN